jgi:hypothetical protein
MVLGDDLTYAKQLASADPSKPNALDKLNSQLSSVYSSLTDLNATQTNALSRQNDIQNIIDKEADRLQSKKAQIDQAAENQKRLIYFNDNSRKVYAAYLKITVTAVITLAIVWIIRIINFHFGSYIPDFITNILLIVTVAIGAIIMYNYYVAIRSRDPYNFDELKLDPPAPLATPSPQPTSSNLNLGVNGLCAGSYCCAPGITVWDTVQKMCVVPIPTPSSTGAALGTSAPTSSGTSAFTLMYGPSEPAEPYGLL